MKSTLQEKKFICVQKCPELDFEGLKHCCASASAIRDKEESGLDYCPCGNAVYWEEFK